MYFCYRWPLEAGRRIKTIFKLLLLYVPVTAVFITLMVLFRDLTYQIVLGQTWEEGRLVARYLYEFPKTLAVFFLIAYDTYTRIAQQRAESERLEAARWGRRDCTPKHCRRNSDLLITRGDHEFERFLREVAS